LEDELPLELALRALLVDLLSVAGQWPLVFNLTEEHGNLLQLLGQPYMQLYGVRYA
jgi:hypothetical protein